MKPFHFFLPGLIMVLAAGAFAQPPKSELLKTPQYVGNSRRPVSKLVEGRTVRDGLKVISGRNSAALEFNTPEVVVYLPEIDNSAYALVEFNDPELFDGRGNRIPFEREGGETDEGTFSRKIWLLKKNGTGPIEFSKVRGSGKIKYPLPEDFAGRPASRPPKILETPGGKTEVRLITKEQAPASKTLPKPGNTVNTNQAKKFPFHTAITVFPQEEVLQLIASGADVNQKDDFGRSPLHLAAYRCDRAKIVKALIDAGAGVNVKTAEGQTPLWWAEQMKCREIIGLLLKAGAR